MNAALKSPPIAQRNSFCFPFPVKRSRFRSAARPPRPCRSGISLIEVLIAVFVLTFGLMGIAMVIPAGRYLMVEAAKSDRGSACGRAALNDMKIRGWLDPTTGWREGRIASFESCVKPGWFLDATNTLYPKPMDALVYGETFLIDPAFFTNGCYVAGTPTCQFFPYSAETTSHLLQLQNSKAGRTWPERALARRIAPVDPSPSPQRALRVFDRVTTWADDLVFSLEGEEQRPRQLFEWAGSSGNSTGAAYPILPADGFDATGQLRLRAQNEGMYTWAALVTPIVPLGKLGPSSDIGIWTWDHDKDPGTPGIQVPAVKLSSISRYEVSVIVFYRRDFYCPTSGELTGDVNPETVKERSVFARIDGGGIGGGDVLLFVKGDGKGATSVPNNPRDGYLNVRKNDWIMLKALDASRGVECPPASDDWHLPSVCKWYRVVSVSEVEPATIKDPSNLSQELQGRGRYVTLAGPDWQVDTLPGYGTFDPMIDIAEAAIVENVVGVYTTTVDVNSL